MAIVVEKGVCKRVKSSGRRQGPDGVLCFCGDSFANRTVIRLMTSCVIRNWTAANCVMEVGFSRSSCFEALNFDGKRLERDLCGYC